MGGYVYLTSWETKSQETGENKRHLLGKLTQIKQLPSGYD